MWTNGQSNNFQQGFTDNVSTYMLTRKMPTRQ